MWNWRQIVSLLADDAQEAANGAAENAGNGGGEAPSIWNLIVFFILPAVVIFTLMNSLLGGPARKDQARRKTLLDTLKKNDQVVTIGGIFGTVVSVSDDKSSVTLRVEDNAKIKFRLDAIREVVSRPGEDTSKAS
jgi:preprotein translocase subunit YajC